MKYDQDDLYLIVDFLEEELERIKDLGDWGFITGRVDMFELTISTIKTLIKE